MFNHNAQTIVKLNRHLNQNELKLNMNQTKTINEKYLKQIKFF